MNLLFITHANLDLQPYGDGSTRYRCFNIAEVARQAGHRVQVRPASSVSSKDLDHFDLISWLRPIASRHMFRLIDSARSLGIICIADLDDLIINTELASQAPSVVNSFSTEKYQKDRFANHAEAVDVFDAITVSTRFLHQQVNLLLPNKPIATIHNGLSDYWVRHAELANQNTPIDETLGYLPGTRSHDQDFFSIRRPLMQWLTKKSTRQLHLVGKIKFHTDEKTSSQIRRAPWVDYFSLPEYISQYSASLAPLTKTVFNESKSHVKFIESAALGVPLVATPIQDIAQHQSSGLLLAEDEQQWSQAIRIASNSDFRKEHGAILKNYVLQNCTATVYATPLLEAWDAGELVPHSEDSFELDIAA